MGKPTFDFCNSMRLGSAMIRGVWNCRGHMRVFMSESIGHKGEPGELKHLSTRRKGHQRDSVSSGERTRTRPVLVGEGAEPVGKPGLRGGKPVRGGRFPGHE